MHANFSLGRLFGLKIGVHWSLPVVVWLIAWSMASSQLPNEVPGRSSVAYWVVGFAAALTFFGCLLAHELAHSVVARRHGVEVTGIVLWLFGGVSQFGGDLPDADTELRVAVVGPATSAALALGFFVATRALGALGVGPLVAAGLGWLGWMNGLLAAFNMVPAFPLDGGRVLRAIRWRRSGDKVAGTVAAAQVGRGFAFVLIGLGVVEFAFGDPLGGVWLVFLGWFLLAASTAEAGHSLLDRQLAGVTVRTVMTGHPVVVPARSTVEDVVEGWLYQHRCSTFPVVEPDGRVVGLVTLARIKAVPGPRRAGTPILEAACPVDAIVWCRPDTPLLELLPRMNASPDQRALVLDGGSLVGIVSPSDVTRVLERQQLALGGH